MRIETLRFYVLGSIAALTLPAVVLAQGEAGGTADKWYSVAISDNEQAFVNETAITLVGTDVQVKVKQNYASPQPAAKQGKTFQSARSIYRLKCAERKIAMVETKAFSGSDLQGDIVQKASRNDRNLIWMDAPRATVYGEILDFGCRKAPAAAPGG
jgi:hypothetical protein